jgi:hypothetical protein
MCFVVLHNYLFETFFIPTNMLERRKKRPYNFTSYTGVIVFVIAYRHGQTSVKLIDIKLTSNPLVSSKFVTRGQV